jgi:hypothetical protein
MAIEQGALLIIVTLLVMVIQWRDRVILIFVIGNAFIQA